MLENSPQEKTAPSRSVTKRVATGVAVLGAAAAVTIGWTQTAQAESAATPIGTITAVQYNGNYCDDFGAHVRVTIAKGTASTQYTLWGTGFMQTSAKVTTTAAGAATIDLHNIGIPAGGRVGVATVLVSTSYYTTSIPVTVKCSSGEGG
ncbi:hypothetical protein [Actinoplanes subglobosus]|uniref:Uncharacterized protein n=1 Tax=Actinoplanes subglobosus TaxID=1547892 RepID=A0ABV8ITS2_9ACTN